MIALQIGLGDEVIIPTMTIISCAQAVVHVGATPVVVDCDADTWNMTAERLRLQSHHGQKQSWQFISMGCPSI